MKVSKNYYKKRGTLGQIYSSSRIFISLIHCFSTRGPREGMGPWGVPGKSNGRQSEICSV